jgi:hypothetical protein
MVNLEANGKRGRGVYFFIDDIDLDKVSGRRWWASTHGKGLFRIETDLRKSESIKWGRVRVSLARFILGVKRRDRLVDHLNGNPLDNRRENLRVCSFKNNIRNRVLLNKNNSSGFRGVSWDRFRGKWVAQLMYNRKHIYLGRFDKKEEAINSVKRGLIKYFGKYA